MKKRNQVTCECSAYTFPHRIGGGKCSGAGWCESYRTIDSSLCSGCNCFNGSCCEVATGTERFNYGECYMSELHSEWLKGKYGNLPKSLEQIAQIEFNNHYS